MRRFDFQKRFCPHDLSRPKAALACTQADKKKRKDVKQAQAGANDERFNVEISYIMMIFNIIYFNLTSQYYKLMKLFLSLLSERREKRDPIKPYGSG
jgi:hypothetical protein